EGRPVQPHPYFPRRTRLKATHAQVVRAQADVDQTTDVFTTPRSLPTLVARLLDLRCQQFDSAKGLGGGGVGNDLGIALGLQGRQYSDPQDVQQDSKTARQHGGLLAAIKTTEVSEKFVHKRRSIKFADLEARGEDISLSTGAEQLRPQAFLFDTGPQLLNGVEGIGLQVEVDLTGIGRILDTAQCHRAVAADGRYHLR